MPCWTTTSFTTTFENAKGHEEILAQALRDLGYNATRVGDVIRFQGNGISGVYRNGRFDTQDGEIDVQQVRDAFGKQAVKAACRKYGWKFVQKGGKTQIIKGR